MAASYARLKLSPSTMAIRITIMMTFFCFRFFSHQLDEFGYPLTLKTQLKERNAWTPMPVTGKVIKYDEPEKNLRQPAISTLM